MMRLLLAILLCATMLTACTWQGERSYLKRVTHVKLSSNDAIEESFDNGEFYTTGVISIEDANKFIAENGLTKFEGRVFVDFSMSMGLSRYPLPKDVGNMYEWSSRSESNTWQFILDANKKLCWYIVKYPDMGGDKP